MLGLISESRHNANAIGEAGEVFPGVQGKQCSLCGCWGEGTGAREEEDHGFQTEVRYELLLPNIHDYLPGVITTS